MARCLRHTGPETPREGCPWPGVTSARDKARAGSPVDRRIASLPDNQACDADSRRTWTTSVQGMSRADSTGDPGSPPGPSSRTLTDAAPRGDVRAIPRRFSDRLSGGTPHGDEPGDSPSEGAPSGLGSNPAITKGSGALRSTSDLLRRPTAFDADRRVRRQSPTETTREPRDNG